MQRTHCVGEEADSGWHIVKNLEIFSNLYLHSLYCFVILYKHDFADLYVCGKEKMKGGLYCESKIIGETYLREMQNHQEKR